MVAGMTPSTVKAGFESTALPAGYRIESAGGGCYNPVASAPKLQRFKRPVPGPTIRVCRRTGSPADDEKNPQPLEGPEGRPSQSKPGSVRDVD